MKSNKEWLEEFQKEINEGYERNRMDRVLARNAQQENKAPKKLPMFDEPIRAYGIPPGGKLPPPVALKLRDVEPKNCGFFCDLKDWAYDPQQYYMSSLMIRLGEILAEREYFWIVKSLLENAGHMLKIETKGELTKADVLRAREKIGEWELFADTLVMPREHVLKLWKEKQLWEAHRIQTGYVPEEQRGPHFWGWLDGFNVYSARFLKNEAVLFNRAEIIVRNTPQVVSFDDIDRPQKLIIEKRCSSAPIIDLAVAKIEL